MPTTSDERERLLRALALATFIIFFQAYMVAPIIPVLSTSFGTSVQATGVIVPAYLIPYGVTVLAFGLLADRIGIQRLIFASLGMFAVLTALTAGAQSIGQLTLWRALTGLGASGVVPLALVLIGGLYPYEQRGRPLGWLFGAMAGGMAFGSTFGAVLEPLLGWRGLFLLVALAAVGVFVVLLLHRSLISSTRKAVPETMEELFRGYRDLIGTPRGQRTYGYVFVNSIFHSGVFTWLGVYFEQRYGLGPVGIGVALLGYGIPGFLFGPLIGRAADRWGRARLLPIGLGLGALGAATLIFNGPLILAIVAVTVLSLGYDMTQPLFGGIVTALGGKRPGQAMGLNVFALFAGFGVGSLLFGEALRLGFGMALGIFVMVQALATALSIGWFSAEVPVNR